jgi:putative flavoprotein involved in K+ transport
MNTTQTITTGTGATHATKAPEDFERIETVVIGAGQAGLSTAYELGKAGRSCLVLDEHQRVGDQWRGRYPSLRLNTPAQYDGLPGMKFPAPKHSFPTGREMADYLEAYVDRFEIDVRGGAHVTSVDRLDDGHYLVTAGGSTYLAENVVVATGGEHHPHLPDVARQLDPGIRQVHSHDWKGPETLLPGAVLVVGAGQSGSDIALECARAGRETWLSGKPPREIPVDIEGRRARVGLPVIWFLWNHVLTIRTPMGRKAQPQVRNGAAPLLRVKTADLDAAGVHRVESRTEEAADGRPQLADGQVLDVANIVWCTGFRQEFGFIHPSVTGPDGWPTDNGGIVEDSPGLYFMGLLFQRGFYSMLIGGAGRDAAFIVKAIRSRARSGVAA